ncbi:acyl-CoA carboxylase epsilon subunit [Streptomyces sp. NPDC020983]|uniref:acyl-CoA carboxylase epsilon subunit n=1 Tax=Streptomyces sp. NPDC020983 TaxID=3365106 RepID=UPI00378F4ED7
MVEIKVERGRPTPEELAAVVALVQARAAAAGTAEAEPSPAARPSAWSAPGRRLPRALPRPAAGAWRMSAWPS